MGNPLVDIRSRLVNHGDFELFRMNSDTERYWRLTTLPEFDGARSGCRAAASTASTTRATDVRRAATIRQQIQILALTGKLRARRGRCDPGRAERPRCGVNHDTGTLLKLARSRSRASSSRSCRVAPDLTPDELRGGDNRQPARRHLPRPARRRTRRTCTTPPPRSPPPRPPTTTDWSPLQNWFRDNFEYSPRCNPATATNAIENFLQIRKGYCEQFAGHVRGDGPHARHPGSRVAVGFTPGDGSAPTAGTACSGRNSHAWPEIWFDGIGWVPFEPTPRRGIPGAEDYTGVAAAQDELDSRPRYARTRCGHIAADADDGVLAADDDPAADRHTRRPGCPHARAAVGHGDADHTQDNGPSLWLLLAVPIIVLLVLVFPAVARRWNSARCPPAGHAAACQLGLAARMPGRRRGQVSTAHRR